MYTLVYQTKKRNHHKVQELDIHHPVTIISKNSFFRFI